MVVRPARRHGSDPLSGGLNTDNSATGNDTLERNAANDLMLGGDGNNWLDAGAGDDNANGNTGVDLGRGGLGRDFVRGGQGNDGGFGDDGDDWHVNGKIGLDSLFGGAGTGAIVGGNGNDPIHAAEEFSFLYPGSGDDTIVAGPGQNGIVILAASGHDQIRGLDLSMDLVIFDVLRRRDRHLRQAEGADDRYADATGSGTRIDPGGGHDLVIYGVSINQFTAGDFQFDPLQ